MTTAVPLATREQEKPTDVCADLKILAAVSRSDKPPPGTFARGSHSYKVTLAFGKRRLTTAFFQGPALVEPPSAADVLSCLVSDVSCGEQSFEDFCSDMGVDVDSRKAEATWKACKAMAPKVRRFLGDHFDRVANAEH